MHHVHEVRTLRLFRFDAPGGTKLLLDVTGMVPTSGWSQARLVPRFGAREPVDGLWEFDFVARAPSGLVVDVPQWTGATLTVGRPDWCRGVRVYAATNAETTATFAAAVLLHVDCGDAEARKREVRVTQPVAAYEDNFQSLDRSTCRRQRHELVLTLSGPIELPIRRVLADFACSAEAARLVTEYPLGGGATWRTASTLLEQLQMELGGDFRARLDDHISWIES
ncbi:hypothetical protein [Scleromatobacter humisilvae]|uniref:Uncharacterized protein n=1 Tax=Scleromatobacter humisilvae TaxID=2897159 RepID=A0A9X2C1Z5_9BURK|nr:hypothetical protein [Scleromatobacter humisilvae]MCK9689388.1 hypothetical protein [Scleromatobacter humisilvae]